MENKGSVYFFTGLSGAGKTTIGGLFHKRLKVIHTNTILLDGDNIRPVYCEDLGYTEEDRYKGAFRTFRVANMLANQGFNVVVCSICMFHDVREWNRKNIANYKEIYIKVKKETLIKRNQKNLYTTGNNVVGVDLPFDEPKNSDIIVENDGELTPLQIIENMFNNLNKGG